MPLVSNRRVSAGSYTWTHGSSVTTGLFRSLENDFVVSPSPCINPSDFRMPGTYSFSKTVVKYVDGVLGGYYYWGNPGNRKRVDNSYDGYFSSVIWDGFGNGGASGFGTPPLYSLEKLSARNRAINKLLDKIKDSEVNMSTTIGEGRETLQMVANIARSVRSPIKALRSAVHRSKKGVP